MIIFLYGQDSFRSWRKVVQIRQKYLLTDESGSGLSVFDCAEEKKPAQKLKDALETSNLFLSKRLIICRNFIVSSESGEQKKLLEFLKKKDITIEKDTVAIFWEESEPRKNNAFFKFFLSSEGVKKQNFAKLSGKKLEQWTLQAFQEICRSAKISPEALNKLIAYCQGDTRLIFSQIPKIINYVDGREINGEDIDLLVRTVLENDIFQTVDALGAGNKKEAVRLVHEHFLGGSDPYYMLSMFAYQFRNMLKVSDLRQRGIFSEYEIAKLASLHPFVVKKTLGQIHKFPFEKLKEIYRKIGELDRAAKTGKIDITLGLDKLMAEI